MEELRIAKEQENLCMEEQRSLIDQQLQEVSDHSLNTLLNFKKHATFHPRQCSILSLCFQIKKFPY